MGSLAAREPRRFLFVFSGGWEERLREVASGSAPAERHGFFVLRKRGMKVDAVDSSLPSGEVWKLLSLALQRWIVIPRSGLGYRVHQARAVRRYLGGDRTTWILATTDSIALPLLALKRRRRVENPIAYFSIGLADHVQRSVVAPWLARRYRTLVQSADVVLVFTPMELSFFEEWAPGTNVHLVPLGVDAAWWRPPPGTAVRAGSVFSAGRDPARSFGTLGKAVDGLPVETTVIGNLAREQGLGDGPRFQVLDDMPIARLRDHLWRAQVVVVPSRASNYGSGQTTALQAMAAGKPVIMTDTGWARHFGLRNGVHFVHVDPESPLRLRDALSELLGRSDGGAELGARSQAAVQEIFTVERQTQAMLTALGTLG